MCLEKNFEIRMENALRGKKAVVLRILEWS